MNTQLCRPMCGDDEGQQNTEALLRRQVNCRKLGVWSTRSDSKCLLKHHRCGPTSGTFDMVEPKRMTHFMRNHVLTILFQGKLAGRSSVNPARRIQPNVRAIQSGTGERIVFASLCLERVWARKSNHFGRASGRIDESVELNPPVWVGQVNCDLFAESLGVIVNIGVDVCTIPDDRSHCVENGKTFCPRRKRKMQCCLPKALRSLCQTGCIYREPALKHLRCLQAKRTDICAATCQKPCPCEPKTEVVLPKEIKTSS